jgi:hypothetical protein
MSARGAGTEVRDVRGRPLRAWSDAAGVAERAAGESSGTGSVDPRPRGARESGGTGMAAPGARAAHESGGTGMAAPAVERRSSHRGAAV